MLSKIWFRFYLSILWVVSCIPIVTIGAASTAYSYVLLKMKEGQEGYVTRTFFQTMKKEWKQSSLIWGVMFLVLVILYFDSNFVSVLVSRYGGWYYGLVPVYYFLLVLALGELLYVFQYIATFEEKTGTVLKNCFLIATRHWGPTFTTLIINGAFLMVTFRLVPGLIAVLPCILGWINVSMVNGVLKKYKE